MSGYLVGPANVYLQPYIPKPGRLSRYSSRVEHARVHRLAAERNRRDRRQIRKGRAEFPVGWKPIGWTDCGVVFENISIDLSGWTAAFEGAGRVIRSFSEAITASVETVLSEGSLTTLLRAYAGPSVDETTGPDTDCCSGSGGRWSDLLARIDELTDGAEAAGLGEGQPRVPVER